MGFAKYIAQAGARQPDRFLRRTAKHVRISIWSGHGRDHFDARRGGRRDLLRRGHDDQFFWFVAGVVAGAAIGSREKSSKSARQARWEYEWMASVINAAFSGAVTSR